MRRLFLLIAGVALVLAGCGGGGGGGGGGGNGLALGRPSVSVLGLATGQTVTVSLNGGAELLFSSNQTRTFPSEIQDGKRYTLSVAGTTGSAVCRFSNGQASMSLSDARATTPVACGEVTLPGEGEGEGEGDGEEGVAQMALTLTDALGQPVGSVARPITASRSGRARAVITSGGVPLVNRVVTFQVTAGSLRPSSGTALTDAQGAAEVTLEASEEGGAGVLTATYQVSGGATVLKTVNYQMEPDSSNPDGPEVQLVELGRGSGATFEPGVLDLSDTALGAGSTLLVTASLVTIEDQQLWSGVATINFTSNCVNAGTAEIDASVNAINGRAVSTYRPLAGCVSDYVQASVVLNGVTKVATSAEIQVEQSPVNSLQFEGASPPVIGLRGSAQAGVPEVSILTFLVLDSNGDPVPAGTEVSFEVVAGAGGFTITSGQQSSTNSEGRVSTTVKSGSVPTLGAVRANVIGTEIVGTGSVSVQTGIASQDRFALAVASLNPRSGARLGTTVEVTVRAADRVGNWVPDGTQINFISELGDIQPSCVAESGGCTVTWTSQGPQTIHYDHVRANRTCFNGTTEEASRKGILETVACGENDRFGRSTITAWAVGEESFTDPNANNLYELGEPWVALPEAFRDDNEDGVWTSAGSYSEFFMDFDENGGYDDVPAVPYFRGLGCSPDAEAAGHCAQLANVRRSSIIVLSTDSVVGYVFSPNANFENARWSAPGGGAPQQWGNTRLRGVTDPGGNYTTDANAEVISLPGDYNGAITVIMTDANGNAPPFGSSILVPTNNASNLTVVGPDRCEVVDMIDPLVCTFYLAPLLQNPTTEGTVVITFGSAVPGNDRTKILQVTIP